jgi:uncharacterized membrane protein YdfJ with MMPL/SSD domain
VLPKKEEVLIRRMLLLVTVVALVAAMVAVTAGTASAKPPAGSADTCPGDYQAMTLEDLLAQAERDGFPEERVRYMFERLNKNQDDLICQTKLPGDVTDYNFIDNQALGLDKS